MTCSRLFGKNSSLQAFFFSSRRRHTRCLSDWSSDVCSSDLGSGLQVDCSLEPVELDEDRQLTVYRTVQESLTNVGKYAEATQVVIALRHYSNHVEVEVRDNGRGFDRSEERRVGKECRARRAA